jgi:hypothetical protein
MMTSDRREWKKKTCCADPTYWDKGTMMMMRTAHVTSGNPAARPRKKERTIICPIDLVLIDQQSVGKRSLLLMDTVNAKKRGTTIYWRVNKFSKKSHIVTRLAKERVSFLKIIHFWERLTVIIVVL